MKRTSKYSKRCPVCHGEETSQTLESTEFEGREIYEFYNCEECNANYTKVYTYSETEIVD